MTIEVTETAIPDVKIIRRKCFEDERGYFMETFNRALFEEHGLETCFVQDNHSRSARNVLRGLHYQLGRAQAKLVRVVRGEVFDVAVDLRRGSPTFGRWVAEILSEENRKMLFIPEGFAHGFLVLSETADFIYKCSDFYAPSCERGIIWNDPDIAVDWPLPPGSRPLLSAKDAAYPRLSCMAESDLPVFSGGEGEGSPS